MDRRIFGLESEYGVTCTFRGQRRLSPDEVARYLFRRVVSWGRSSNVFLENGARLYLDVGSHPEYATPECDSVTDLIAHTRAGMWAGLCAAQPGARLTDISAAVEAHARPHGHVINSEDDIPGYQQQQLNRDQLLPQHALDHFLV